MLPSWFPEPSKMDNSWALRGEQPLDWIARSTLPRAKAIRRFLNENLSQLPDDTQPKIFNAFRHRFKSAFFELIVARTLQILGAEIEVEVKQQDNKQPDFLAHFQDCRIIVEAVSPNFNAKVGEEIKNRNPLTDIVESLVPEGWSVQVWQLPQIGQADSKKPFKQVVTQMLSVPPPTDAVSEIDLIEELPAGTIHLRLTPRRPSWTPIALEPSFGVVDDSKTLIRKVVRRKRKQVRRAEAPVLLAIEGSWLSSSLESFDLALYGHTCEVINANREREEPRFIPDGLFTNISSNSPIYAGVLAFPEVGFKSVTSPTLFHHPRFRGHLPAALSMLEQHWYEPTVNSVRTHPSSFPNLLAPFKFVSE
jgi:hypothetical protein